MHVARSKTSTGCHGYVTHSKARSLSCLGLLSVLSCCMLCCLKSLYCVGWFAFLVIVYVGKLVCVVAVCGSGARDDQ